MKAQRSRSGWHQLSAEGLLSSAGVTLPAVSLRITLSHLPAKHSVTSCSAMAVDRQPLSVRRRTLFPDVTRNSTTRDGRRSRPGDGRGGGDGDGRQWPGRQRHPGGAQHRPRRAQAGQRALGPPHVQGRRPARQVRSAQADGSFCGAARAAHLRAVPAPFLRRRGLRAVGTTLTCAPRIPLRHCCTASLPVWRTRSIGRRT